MKCSTQTPRVGNRKAASTPWASISASRASRFTKAGSTGTCTASASFGSSEARERRNSRSEPGRSVVSKLSSMSARKVKGREPIRICSSPASPRTTWIALSR